MAGWLKKRKAISILESDFGLNRFEIIDSLLDVFIAGKGNEYDVAIYYVISRARTIGYYDSEREKQFTFELNIAKAFCVFANGNQRELFELIEKGREFREMKSSEPFEDFDTWLGIFKRACAEENSMLAVDESGRSLIDFMENERFMRAFQDRINPEILARNFASTFHPDTFGR